MHNSLYVRTAVVTALLLIVFIAAWETGWRSRGYTATFNDDKSLWADKRKEVYTSPKEATVFTGSSRVKFDLDIPTWKKISGEDAVQLALVGTSPLLVLKDLAEDEKFRGKLVIDVTEPLFFSQNPFFHKSAVEAITHYHKQTPAEKIGANINLALEENLAFLEEKRFSLSSFLTDLGIPDRPGVFSLPAFPKGFDLTTRDRQTYMADHFLSNPKDIEKQTGIWTMLIMGDKTPVVSGKELEKIFLDVAEHVKKIRSRGGKVIFIRTPSSGPMGEGENAAFPREIYFDQLLKYSGSEGIHFRDHPETRDLICPEWSHLSREQAVGYTHHLFRILKEKNWFN